MIALGKNNFNSSISTIYLFVCLLLFNQLFTIQSFRLSSNDLEQNETDDLRRAVVRQLSFDKFSKSDDSSDENALQAILDPSVQRRFCCMSPLSGRKRSARDLARQQIANSQA